MPFEMPTMPGINPDANRGIPKRKPELNDDKLKNNFRKPDSSGLTGDILAGKIKEKDIMSLPEADRGFALAVLKEMRKSRAQGTAEKLRRNQSRLSEITKDFKDSMDKLKN